MASLRNLIGAVLMASAASTAMAEPLDFGDMDKQLHVSASTLVGLAARHVTTSPHQAMGACLAVGAAKELAWQVAGYTKFSHADMAANAVGCALGAYVVPGLSIKSTSTGLSVSFRWSF